MQTDGNCAFFVDHPESLVLFLWMSTFKEVLGRLIVACKKNYKIIIIIENKKSGFRCNLTPKDVIFYFDPNNLSVGFVMNLLILLDKFNIHECRLNNSKPFYYRFSFIYRLAPVY